MTIRKDDKELERVFQACAFSTEAFGKVFMPNAFSRPFNRMRREIIEVLDTTGIPKKAIIAPRGIGKSTIVRAYMARRILYREKHFIPYISASSPLAMQRCEDLKKTLTQNSMVRKVFGPMTSKTWKNDFSKEQWVVKAVDDEFGTMVIPRGRGQQIRGSLYDSFRPDLVIIDDLEKKEELRNESICDATVKWFSSDVRYCIDVERDDWEFITTGTYLGDNAFIVYLMDDPSWISVNISLCTDDFTSRDEQYMSTEKIRDMVKEHERLHTLAEFCREMMGKSMPEGEGKFREEYFKEYDPTDQNLFLGSGIVAYVIVDPAKSEGIHSDDTAIIGLSVNYMTGELFFRDIIHGKLLPDEMYKQAVDMAIRLGAREIGVEITSLENFIREPFNAYLRRNAPHMELISLKARGRSKNDRIESLLPYCREGLVKINPNSCRVLKMQLMQFPNSKKKDVSDAAAYSVDLMARVDRHFAPKGMTPVDKAKLEGAYREAKKMGMAPVMGWRVA